MQLTINKYNIPQILWALQYSQLKISSLGIEYVNSCSSWDESIIWITWKKKHYNSTVWGFLETVLCIALHGAWKPYDLYSTLWNLLSCQIWSRLEYFKQLARLANNFTLHRLLLNLQRDEYICLINICIMRFFSSQKSAGCRKNLFFTEFKQIKMRACLIRSLWHCL